MANPFSAQPLPKTTAPSRMQLSTITRGRVGRPMRVLLYGTEGIGKTTFASNAPAPIFLASEDGTSELDVARFPVPKTWQDVLDAVAELTTAEHDYHTLVVDTLDWLEPIVWAHVVVEARNPKIKSIDDIGYNKGYNAAYDVWRVFIAALERLRNVRGMHVVLVAHAWIKTFHNPEGEDFDRYEMKPHKLAAGALKEWSDAVLFAKYETFAHKDDKTKRVRGVSSGARIVHTQRVAAWDAKNRYDLPETLPLDWHAFADAVAARRPVEPRVSRERIEVLLEQADDELRTLVRDTVTKAGEDAASLARIADRLAAKINLQMETKEGAE
jgi:hypothetical protein